MITVLGGGIVGLATALTLQAEGLDVTVIDREVARQAAGYGNCALLAVGEVVPISKPGVIKKIPGWLMDPKGPLHVRPSAMVTQLPWLLRFLWSGRASRVRQIAEGMAPVLHRAEGDWRGLLEASAMGDALVAAENVFAMNARSDYEAEAFTWGLRALHGFQHEFLTGERLREMEPALGGPISCGVLAKGWLQFADPGAILEGFRALFVARGGKVITGDARRIETKGGRAVALALADGQRVAVDRLVLAAGAWSGRLARDLGLRLPVAALQGYHLQLKENFGLTRPVLYSNGGFVLTPLASGLRIGGTIEVAGHDPQPNFARAKILGEKALKILPGLDLEGAEEWMGPRPFMPDTLPVIGQHGENVFLACGHGQVGQTLAATTGKIIADLVQGRETLDLSPYSPTRF